MENLLNVFALSEAQKSLIFFLIIFVLLMIMFYYVQAELRFWAQKNNLTWKKALRPIAYVTLIMIAFIETVVATVKSSVFYKTLKVKINKVNEASIRKETQRII